MIQEHQDDAVIKHQYDVLGNRIRTILPDGQILDYRHDKEGLYDKIQLNGQILTQLSRDSIGRETSRTQGKLSSHFEYDPMGRLKKHYVSDHLMPLIQREYGHDKAGNLNFIKDLEKDETHIQYDALDRLRSVNDEVFAFDPASNIIINDGKQAGYSQGGRLQMQGDRHFEYDDAGNLIRERRGKGGKLVTEYCYNTENQLIQVIKQGQVISYKYDALGRRISKQDAFGETTFLWNGDVLLSETCNHIHKTYIYEPYSFEPLAFLQDGEVYYYHLDHLGTPQEITDAQGEIVWSVRYKAYGNVVRKEVERVENNLRFQGQYFDEETGLHYNRFRYYDPDVGRFIHQDPIGFMGGVNLYQYAPNPVAWVDPLGLTTPWVRGQFDEWFDAPSTTPEMILNHKKLVSAALRHGGGKHEFFPVSMASKAKQLGFSASEIKSMSVNTNQITFTNVTDKDGIPVPDGGHTRTRAGRHFHIKLMADLDAATTKEEAKQIIKTHHDRHMKLNGVDCNLQL